MNIEYTKFIRPREVAEILKLNLLTVYTYIRDGRLPAVKIGRNYRVAKEDLEKFIKLNRVKVRK